MSPFWNPAERRLRTLWRLILHAMLALALGLLPVLLIAEPLTALHRRGLFLPAYSHDSYDRIINMIVGPFLTAAVIGSVALAGKYLDHRPFEAFGVAIDATWWRDFLLGLGIASVSMALVFLLEYGLGLARVTGAGVVNASGVSFGFALLFSAVKVVCVGTYEEFVSRGYHLRNLADGLTLPGGVAVSALIFSLLHLGNENTTILSTLGLFINGLFFTTALLATGRLSAAIGAHIGWNFAEGAVFGFPVSGEKEGASLLGLDQGGPVVLTGGPFGPEGGAAGVVASLIGIGLFLAWHRGRRASTSPAA
jgi:hypothetical protein